MLRLDDSNVHTIACPTCGRSYDRVAGYVSNEDGPFAMYFAQRHADGHAAWVDVILGTWGTPEPVPDHVNFAALMSSDDVQLADAPAAGNPGGWRGGEPLSRLAAARHPWLGAFRSVVELIAAEDATVRDYLDRPWSGDIHGH